MNAYLHRAQQMLDDPRPPAIWASQPGQATELLSVLRAVVTALVEAHASNQLAAATVEDLMGTVRSQRAEMDELGAAILLEHARSDFDGCCGTCRVPHPCLTTTLVKRGGRA